MCLISACDLICSTGTWTLHRLLRRLLFDLLRHTSTTPEMNCGKHHVRRSLLDPRHWYTRTAFVHAMLEVSALGASPLPHAHAAPGPPVPCLKSTCTAPSKMCLPYNPRTHRRLPPSPVAQDLRGDRFRAASQGALLFAITTSTTPTVANAQAAHLMRIGLPKLPQKPSCNSRSQSNSSHTHKLTPAQEPCILMHRHETNKFCCSGDSRLLNEITDPWSAWGHLLALRDHSRTEAADVLHLDDVVRHGRVTEAH